MSSNSNMEVDTGTFGRKIPLEIDNQNGEGHGAIEAKAIAVAGPSSDSDHGLGIAGGSKSNTASGLIVSEDQPDKSKDLKEDVASTVNHVVVEVGTDPDSSAASDTEMESNKSNPNISEDRGPWVMTNNLVIEKIAEKLPVEKLWELRQTCIVWEEAFISQFGKKHVLVELDGFESGKNFMDLIRSSRKIPFKRYRLYMEQVELDELESALLPQEFVVTLGNIVTTLCLLIQPAKLDLVEAEFRSMIFDSMPHLMELSLTVFEFDPSIIPKDEEQLDSSKRLELLPTLEKMTLSIMSLGLVHPIVTRLVSDIIKCASKLDYFDFNIAGARNPTVGDFLKSADTHLSQLKTLNKVGRLEMQDLQDLNQLARQHCNKLQLESLKFSIQIHGSESQPLGIQTIRLFYEFLLTQSPTLKKLSLNFSGNFDDGDDDEDVFTYVIPRMERLKNLTVHFYGSIPPEWQLQFEGQNGSATFMETFPKLRQLTYSKGNWNDGPVDNFTRYFHPEVAYLDLRAASHSYAAFLKFGQVFPTLSRLDLYLDEDSMDSIRIGTFRTFSFDMHVDVKEFGKIWKTWPNLTAIHLKWSASGIDLDMDALLSGISRPQLNGLKHEIDREDVGLSTLTLDSLRAKLDTYKTRPAISDLTQLQDLTIIVDGRYSMPPQLTDMGAYFGLAFANPHLQRAVIHGDGKNLVSEQCVSYIKNVFGPHALIEL